MTADPDHNRRLLCDMLRIRRFEEKCAELYSGGRIRGFLHLYIGEEAVAVGVLQALAPEDAVVATYREHGHALARGLPARPILGRGGGRRGRVPRVDEPGGALAPAAAVLLREQPLRDGHGAGAVGVRD